MKLLSLHHITPIESHKIYKAYAVAKVETFNYETQPQQQEAEIEPVELSPYRENYFAEDYIAYIVVGIKKSKEVEFLLSAVEAHILAGDGSDSNTLLLNDKSSYIIGKEIVNIIKAKEPSKSYQAGIKIKKEQDNLVEFRDIKTAINALKMLFRENLIKKPKKVQGK